MLNNIQLIGNVGQKPVIKTFDNGGKVANLSIATTESWNDKKTGEKKVETQWHRIVVHNEALISIIERFVDKGDRILVQGTMKYREFEKEGNKYIAAEVVLGFNGKILLLSSKRDKEDKEPDQTVDAVKDDIKSPKAFDALDDEIPF